MTIFGGLKAKFGRTITSIGAALKPASGGRVFAPFVVLTAAAGAAGAAMSGPKEKTK